MILLELNKVILPNTMGPNIIPETLIIYLPFDLIGIIEEHKYGAMITLRNNMGSVIVKETAPEIKEKITITMTKFAAAQRGIIQ